MSRSILLLAAAALSIPAAALAHPKLVTATPAANASVAAPAKVTLKFSEKLMPNFSGADLTMTGMKGMAHSPMKVASVAAVAPDGQTLVVTPNAKLGAGNYVVAWHVVSTDTHRVTGTLAFSVK